MLLFVWSAAWADVLTWSCRPLPHWRPPLCHHGPSGQCLLIKTPPIHSSGWIFSIIWSHWCPSGPVLMSRARVPMMLWPPVPMAVAPVCSGPRSGLTSDWLVQAPWPGLCAPSPRHRPSCRAQCSALGARPDWALSWAPTGPQSRFWQGLGNLTATLPTTQKGKMLAKMNQFDSWWLLLGRVTHHSNKLFIVPIFVNISQPKVASAENIKLLGKVFKRLGQSPGCEQIKHFKKKKFCLHLSSESWNKLVYVWHKEN